MSNPGQPALNHAFFVKFDFLSGPYYVWNGFRYLDLAGHIWSPVGPKATITQIEDPVSDSIQPIMLSVSGVDPGLLALALSETNQIRGRLAFISDCYFDNEEQPIGVPEPYSMTRMDTLKIRRQADGESWQQVIEISSEHFLTNGPNPVAGRYSSADQAQRYPLETDLYFDYMSQNQNRVQRWPTA